MAENKRPLIPGMHLIIEVDGIPYLTNAIKMDKSPLLLEKWGLSSVSFSVSLKKVTTLSDLAAVIQSSIEKEEAKDQPWYYKLEKNKKECGDINIIAFSAESDQISYAIKKYGEI